MLFSYCLQEIILIQFYIVWGFFFPTLPILSLGLTVSKWCLIYTEQDSFVWNWQCMTASRNYVHIGKKLAPALKKNQSSELFFMFLGCYDLQPKRFLHMWLVRYKTGLKYTAAVLRGIFSSNLFKHQRNALNIYEENNFQKGIKWNH